MIESDDSTYKAVFKMKSYFITQEFLLRPSTSKKLILYSIVMLMSASLTSGKATVSLELIRYNNPTHHELNGNCCDWFCWKFLQLGVCDNRFSLCIDEVYGYGDSESMDDCDYLKRDNFHSGNDEFSFPSTFESYDGNPIVFEVPDYRGGIRVKIDIWDKEVFHRINPEDHVDFYTQDIFVKPSTTSYRTLYGRGSSTTDIKIQVLCVSDFYDDNCSTYCTASDSDWKGHYTCDPSTGAKICRSGYEGQECNTDIDECKSSPCQNGGGCRDHLNSFTCVCVEGTSGSRCQINLDECASHPCQHRSSCIDQINGYQCQCVHGYTGPTCGIDVDECASGPCENGAKCHDRVNGYTCECPLGYEGFQCDLKIDVCAKHPCENKATCVDLINTFSCECASGYEGEFCQMETDECQSNPCQNSGSCVDMTDGFQCDCVAGYYGLVCEKDVDECASEPCANGATCIDGVNGYFCSCACGFVGDLCETEIDECQSNPCQNSGTCVDMINGFQCDCMTGYYGLLCETDRDECASEPCANEGKCIDDVNGYFCTCASGFFGVHCEEKKNEHDISPGSKFIPWFWLLIGIPTIVVFGILLALYFNRVHNTKRSGKLEVLKSNIKYQKLSNSDTIQ